MGGFDINQLMISGNLTRDPELRQLPSGQSVCNIRIAHNERKTSVALRGPSRPDPDHRGPNEANYGGDSTYPLQIA